MIAWHVSLSVSSWLCPTRRPALTSAQAVDVVPVLGKPIPITRRPASMSGIGCQEADIKLPDGTRVGNGLWGSSVLRSPRRAASGRAPPQLMPTNTTCQIISVAACAGIPTPRVQPGSDSFAYSNGCCRPCLADRSLVAGRGDMLPTAGRLPCRLVMACAWALVMGAMSVTARSPRLR